MTDDAWQMDFESEADYADWLRDSAARSQFHAGILPSLSDRLLTLSTCTYEFDDARYVLSDQASLDEFSNRLANRAIETKCGVLTLMADRRVPAGDVMKIMAVAKAGRLLHVQLAEKRD